MQRRYWTALGTLNAVPTPESTPIAIARIKRSMAEPSFVGNIDAQAEILAFIKSHGEALGTEQVQDLVGALQVALVPKMPAARLGVILQLDKLNEIRAALRRTYSEPRPFTADERPYLVDGWLGQYVLHAREGNSPVVYHFWCAAAALGAALRRNVYMAFEYDLFANQNTIIVGPTGMGKSAAVGALRPLLNLTNTEWYEAAKAEYEWPVSGLPDRRSKVLPKDVPPEQMLAELVPKGLWSPPDVEGTQSLLDDESIGAMIVDEMVALLGKHKYGASTLLHILTDLYNCDDRPKSTRTYGKEDLKNVALTVVLASTLEWINDAITEDMFQGGFTSRFMFVARHQRPFIERDDAPPIDPVEMRRLARGLTPWMLLRPSEITFSDTAKLLWRDIKTERREMLLKYEGDHRMQPYYERKQNLIAMAAMLLLCSSYTPDDLSGSMAERTQFLEKAPFILGANVLEQAKQLVELEEPYLPDLFNNLGVHRDSRAVDRALVWLKRNQPAKKGDWYQQLRKQWPTECERVHTMLMKSGQIETYPYQSKRGPSSLRVRLVKDEEIEA